MTEPTQELAHKKSFFDRFAGRASDFVSHAPFFVACVALCAIWAPTILIFGSIDTWQLVINTVTTIITFLLVALLQNTQRRGEEAIHSKLDAISDALADLMERQLGEGKNFHENIRELKAAVGLETKV